MKGKYETMQNEEHKILKIVDARNNPEFFNKSNGSPASQGIDRDAVKELYEYILCQVPVLENAKELKESTESIQVRVADEQKRIYNIASLIDDNKGDTVATGLRVSVLEEYYDNQQEDKPLDAIIDGNHSTGGTVVSKHAVDVPVVRIPLEKYAHLNNAEIKLLGNFLNRQNSKLDIKSNSDEDLIKMIRTNYDEENIDPMSEESFEILSDLNVPSRTAKSLMKKAAKQIEENRMNMNGKKIIDYSSGESKRKLAAKLEAVRNTGQLAYDITSGSGGSVQTLLGKVMEDFEEGMTKVTVFVRHPLPSYYEDWNNGEKGSSTRDMFAWCVAPRGLEVEFLNLPHIQDDSTFATAVL